jgi:hypothetical protein
MTDDILSSMTNLTTLKLYDETINYSMRGHLITNKSISLLTNLTHLEMDRWENADECYLPNLRILEITDITSVEELKEKYPHTHILYR